jgi:outer membrane protein OmpU
MKKVLFATTALLLSAGVASADVTLGGDARMGFYNDGTDTVQQQRARVQFKMSGESDNGLSFGTSFRVTGGAGDAGTASVFVSGTFGTLSLGPDNDNALVATTHNVPHLGVLDNAGGSRRTALGAGSAALYTFSTGDLSVAASTTLNTDEVSVAAKYALGDVSIAAGYEDNGTESHTLVSAAASVGGVGLVGYSGTRSSDDANQMGLSAAYTMDAVTVTVRLKNDFADLNHMGAGLVYNLGGGARLGASVNNVENADTTFDLGMSFSF